MIVFPSPSVKDFLGMLSSIPLAYIILLLSGYNPQNPRVTETAILESGSPGMYCLLRRTLMLYFVAFILDSYNARECLVTRRHGHKLRCYTPQE